MLTYALLCAIIYLATTQKEKSTLERIGEKLTALDADRLKKLETIIDAIVMVGAVYEQKALEKSIERGEAPY